MRRLFIGAVWTLLPLAAWPTTPQTAVLDVQNMTCGLCPITVKKSLQKVGGVSEVAVDFAKKTATVKFDADITNASALMEATAKAGYPSTVRK
jgi:periplasmic mercuric ion binding protein